MTGGGWQFCAMRLCLTCRIVLFSLLFLLLAVFNVGGGIGPAKAADSRGQLVMITSSHCPWCESFEDDVGKGYDRTEEALVYPLRRHDFYQKMPDDLAHLTPATMTPTFIVLRDGVEVGRIVGYPGAELFWWRISEFTAQ
jgi:thioredoxin-related protein